MSHDKLRSVTLGGIQQLRSNHPKFDTFLGRLCDLGGVAIAGGAPRDWYLGRPPSDLDLTLAAPTDSLRDLVQPYTPERTRFGGWRMVVGGVGLDVWCIHDTWLFQQRGEAGSFADIPRAVSLTIDTATVVLQTGEVYEDRFFDSCVTKTIDLVDPRVEPLGGVDTQRVRVLRLAKRYGFTVGAETRRVLGIGDTGKGVTDPHGSTP